MRKIRDVEVVPLPAPPSLEGAERKRLRGMCSRLVCAYRLAIWGALV
jgi:hypothetical protein